MTVTATMVRDARTQRGLTQSQAAQVIQAALRTWQAWEAGKRNMPAAKYAAFIMLAPPPLRMPGQP